ncbi:SDR family oxidoreductase [Actinoplanes sp. TRM 88003]|uniref:SDR family oxidoreductase n=1 Tax=Paractinoplanes aksuensis TaxID=2939490 RepID=A0ABT1DRK8_9ACTN|nr:SDR family oxidoreductase [Actinoplanes aksuensis]MCO8273481.1 SDR family oxidoreductase [Actinoplanes aksuensis]
MSEKVVLVTGASSGFGRLTVEALARRGHHVFAALRDVNGRNTKAAAELAALAADEGLSLQVVELDVTDQISAEEALAVLLKTAGRLDAVVNNAGGIFPGPVEAFTAEEAQRQFDLNVFGALRVARAALPTLREQGHGVLIQVGSVSSRVTIPYSGLYAASKAALGSLTEAWHHELAPFGVEAVIVDAASYPTSIGTNAVLPADSARFSAYGEGFGRYVAALTERQTQDPGDPTAVSDAIVALVEAPDGRRPLRTVVAPLAQLEAVRTLNQRATETARTVAAEMGIGAFLAGH